MFDEIFIILQLYILVFLCYICEKMQYTIYYTHTDYKYMHFSLYYICLYTYYYAQFMHELEKKKVAVKMCAFMLGISWVGNNKK